VSGGLEVTVTPQLQEVADVAHKAVCRRSSSERSRDSSPGVTGKRAAAAAAKEDENKEEFEAEWKEDTVINKTEKYFNPDSSSPIKRQHTKLVCF
jgi:hypothetical protein